MRLLLVLLVLVITLVDRTLSLTVEDGPASLLLSFLELEFVPPADADESAAAGKKGMRVVSGVPRV